MTGQEGSSPSSSYLDSPEHLAFVRLMKHCHAMARARHPGASEFRLVRRNDGEPAGWTFHTGNYPQGSFGWVSVKARVAPSTHEVRLLARKSLKEQGETS